MSRNGYVVKTPSGKLGRVYHDDERVKGKVKVYLFDKDKTDKEVGVLCNPDDLRVCGFVD